MTPRVRRRRELALVVAAGSTVLPLHGARALEAGLRATARGWAQEVPVEILRARLLTDTLSSTSAADRLAAQLHLIGFVEERPIPAWGLRLGLDSGLIEVTEVDGATRVLVDGLPFEERAAETGFLGETFVEVELGRTGWVELRAGKLRPRLGQGALFDAYGLGFSADVDLSLLDPELAWSGRLHVLLPDASFTARGKKSPFAALEVGTRVAPWVEARLLCAFLYDGDDGVAPLLRDVAVRGALERVEEARARTLADTRPILRPGVDRAFDRWARRIELATRSEDVYQVDTEGWLAWVGGTLAARGRGFELEAVALLGLGELTLGVGPGPVLADVARRFEALAELGERREAPVGLLSGFGQITGRVELERTVALSGFLVGMTGDSGLRPDEDGRRRYGAFVGLAPLLTHTSLFFLGGVAPTLASPTLASPAPDGAGLLGGGAALEVEPRPWLFLRTGAGLMASTEPSLATEGRLYGVEVDLLVDAFLHDAVLATVDLAVFLPLDYFGDVGPALQGIVGVTALVDLP